VGQGTVTVALLQSAPVVVRRRHGMGRAQQAHAGPQNGRCRKHPEGHVHVGDERRQPLHGETAEVTIASTKAIDSTAPVFCSRVRAPAAMPLRWGGTEPIIAAVFGLLNIPEPTPTTISQSPLCK